MIARVIVLISLLLIAPMAWAKVSVETSKTDLKSGEQFSVIFNYEGSIDIPAPDFSELEQTFSIHSADNGARPLLVNGQVLQLKFWRFTLSSETKGKKEIAPIKFGEDTTKKIIIDVK